MAQKACRGCGEVLSLDGYYRHPEMLDGHLNYCKTCVKNRLRDSRINDPRVLERERRRGRKYDRERMKKYRTKEVQRANNAVAGAIRRGELVRPDECSECGAEGRIEAAHSDYSRPLEIRWLCHRCHSRWDVVQPKTAPYRVAS